MPPDLRKRIWAAIGGPGTVLVAGQIVGVWRAAKKGKRLLVTAEVFGRLTETVKDELVAEARHIAPFRGADTAELQIGP